MKKTLSKKKLLITGATGAVGQVVALELLNQGYKIRALVRQQPPPNVLDPAIELVFGGLSDVNALKQATAGVHAVIHLAAKLHINNPTPDMAGEYTTVNVEGTQNLVQAAQNSGVPHFVFFSTINVYGPTGAQAPFTERSPLNPESLYALTKCQGEKIVRGFSSETPEQYWTILRLAAVYGQHMRGNYLRLFNAIRSRYYIPIGPGSNRRTLVYDRDVAKAVIQVLNRQEARNQILNLTDGNLYQLKEITAAMGKAVGRNIPNFYLPTELVRRGLLLVEKVTALFNRGRPIVKAALIDKFLEDIAVDGTKIQQEIGFLPSYTLQQGWHEVAVIQQKKHSL